eukprot:Gb_41529 [translate_table: standard]
MHPLFSLKRLCPILYHWILSGKVFYQFIHEDDALSVGQNSVGRRAFRFCNLEEGGYDIIAEANSSEERKCICVIGYRILLLRMMFGLIFLSILRSSTTTHSDL